MKMKDTDTMLELHDLAVKLAILRIYVVSLETDIDSVMRYYSACQDCLGERPFVYDNIINADTNKPPGFTIYHHGVKMYINDPKTKFESR